MASFQMFENLAAIAMPTAGSPADKPPGLFRRTGGRKNVQKNMKLCTKSPPPGSGATFRYCPMILTAPETPRADMEDTEVHDILARVLASGIATPGTKLGERQLAELFRISRDRMRRVLHRLGYEGKLELVPNRGARTIDPGLADARVVYGARRVLEGGIVLAVTERLASSELDALFDQHEREREAIARDDRSTALALGGALHMRLAELTGNPLIVSMLRSMVDRTSTLLSFFGPNDGPACSCREHSTIMAALASRDPLQARDAMCSHLSLVETRLHMRPRCEAVDVDTLIRSELERHPAYAGTHREHGGIEPRAALPERP